MVVIAAVIGGSSAFAGGKNGPPNGIPNNGPIVPAGGEEGGKRGPDPSDVLLEPRIDRGEKKELAGENCARQLTKTSNGRYLYNKPWIEHTQAYVAEGERWFERRKDEPTLQGLQSDRKKYGPRFNSEWDRHINIKRYKTQDLLDDTTSKCT